MKFNFDNLSLKFKNDFLQFLNSNNINKELLSNTFNNFYNSELNFKDNLMNIIFIILNYFVNIMGWKLEKNDIKTNNSDNSDNLDNSNNSDNSADNVNDNTECENDTKKRKIY